MDSWVELFGAVTALLTALSQKKQADEAHVEQTLQALNSAYYATEGYFAALQEGGLPSQERQFQVAQSWDNASHMVRRYDQNLASRLSLKSRFWREGAAWTEEQREQANIGLAAVRRDGRLLLMPKFRRSKKKSR
ncbi:hypothetical protein JM946_14210 [Steroidobacter sp. S1-65]|uniref:Uncharacterized protein n=1 Tax=Steroidobacter gossypii TaxID=2805490 RepID=A0ABS1WY36_9GAMM|nr:hypothetical protein [Steroidobacter gossypii]MBM0105881.1 hypothetical protein [Steroidobacter gossypii]